MEVLIYDILWFSERVPVWGADQQRLQAAVQRDIARGQADEISPKTKYTIFTLFLHIIAADTDNMDLYYYMTGYIIMT